PWFGIYGQMSGFNSLKEAYEDLAPYVYGIETGLSSDPEMNWQMEELSTRSILSFSDAHSPAKMGREATVFRLEELSYENIRKAIMAPSISRNKKQETNNKVLYTIEFYPEEGKYHYSGHRNCNVTMTPQEQEAVHNICPVCKRNLTDGVMRRVQELAQEDARGSHKTNASGLTWITDTKSKQRPFVKIVPLKEIIAEAIGSPFASPKVLVIFNQLCKEGESEFHVLLKLPLADIEKAALSITSPALAEKITDGVKKVRAEQIVIQPGYDGVFGVVKIWQDEESKETKGTNETKDKKEQIGLEF
ncbi:MAG TPA: endonuclease Q family protein, partial [Candidatus Eisenbacteria bacterium]|nr:endonuclease Q family protein [Candidatus Eisenbacteria bacterium]